MLKIIKFIENRQICCNESRVHFLAHSVDSGAGRVRRVAPAAASWPPGTRADAGRDAKQPTLMSCQWTLYRSTLPGADPGFRFGPSRAPQARI